MTCCNPVLLEEDLTFLQGGVTSRKLCLTNLIALCERSQQMRAMDTAYLVFSKVFNVVCQFTRYR